MSASHPRPEGIQTDIERTREHLGETVQELAHRLDPKARAKARARQARHAGASLYQRRRGEILTTGAVMVTLVVGALVWRHRG